MQVALHSPHCILSTIFLVVLACGHVKEDVNIIAKIRASRNTCVPSCGRRASSDHRSRTAFGRNDAYLQGEWQMMRTQCL
jgi:hypothetical protein